MNGLASTLVVLSLQVSPVQPQLCVPTAQTVQGNQAYCCTRSNGSQCCSPTLDATGAPSGCGC